MTIIIKEKEAKNLRSGINNHDWREERERGNVINYNFIINLKLYIIKKCQQPALPGSCKKNKDNISSVISCFQ